jgi:hypothetical protein
MTFTAAALRISSGVIVWAVHFAVIYGITALACARDSPGAVPWTVGVATLVAAAGAAAIVGHGYRRRSEFIGWMSAAVAVAALVAIVFEAFAGLTVPACG